MCFPRDLDPRLILKGGGGGGGRNPHIFAQTSHPSSGTSPGKGARTKQRAREPLGKGDGAHAYCVFVSG